MKSFLIFFLFISISAFSQTDSLRHRIHQIIQNKNAKVGLAIRGLENGDTLSINGATSFPLFSVVKIPTALTVLHLVDMKKLSLDSSIHFVHSFLDTNTFSPIRDEINKVEFDLTIRELLSYSISRSDNIAFEKLVELAGGIKVVSDYSRSMQHEIFINATGKDGLTEYIKNSSTPLAMNSLLIKIDQKKFLSNGSRDLFWKLMKETKNAPNRIKGLLPEGTIVMHKPGTSGADDNGLNIAFNDVGIVTLPNGNHFVISVFITNSTESDEVNASIIAEISKAAWDYFIAKN
jgi:beta-lactamase class A